MSKKDIKEVTQEVLGRYGEMFANLAPKDNLAYDIGEWILDNQEGLKSKLRALERPLWHLMPHHLQEVFLEQFEKAAINVIRDEVAQSFGLNPEERLNLVGKRLLKKLIPDLLHPTN